MFHLADIVSGGAEADFDAGIRANLDGTRYLLERLRQVGAQRTARGLGPVRLVHASSIAVYGAPMPARIEDDTQPWPTLSYGAHKLASELLYFRDPNGYVIELTAKTADHDREMDPQHNPLGPSLTSGQRRRARGRRAAARRAITWNASGQSTRHYSVTVALTRPPAPGQRHARLS